MLFLLASGALLYVSGNRKSKTELQIHTRRFKVFKIRGISLSCEDFFPLRGKTTPKARSDEGDLCAHKPKATLSKKQMTALLALYDTRLLHTSPAGPAEEDDTSPEQRHNTSR